MNRAGKHPEQLQDADSVDERIEEPTYRAEEDSITRFDKAKRRRNKSRNNKGRDRKEAKPQGEGAPKQEPSQEPKQAPKPEQKSEPKEQPHAEQPNEQRGEQRGDRNNRGRRFHRRPNNGERKPKPTSNND